MISQKKTYLRFWTSSIQDQIKQFIKILVDKPIRIERRFLAQVNPRLPIWTTCKSMRRIDVELNIKHEHKREWCARTICSTTVENYDRMKKYVKFTKVVAQHSILRTLSIQVIVGGIIWEACIACHSSSLRSTFTLREFEVVAKSSWLLQVLSEA